MGSKPPGFLTSGAIAWGVLTSGATAGGQTLCVEEILTSGAMGRGQSLCAGMLASGVTGKPKGSAAYAHAHTLASGTRGEDYLLILRPSFFQVTAILSFSHSV